MNSANRPDYIVPQFIDDLLCDVRFRLRTNILLIGICKLIVIAVFLFYAATVLDYLPVWLGQHESPRWFRLVMLVFIVGICGWHSIKNIFVLAMRNVSNDNLAILIERKIPGAKNMLLTIVDANKHSDVHDSQNTMDFLQATESRIADLLKPFSPRSLFDNHRSRIWAGGTFVALFFLAGSIFVVPQTMEIAGQRILGLSQRAWPRFHHIELLGARNRLANLLDEIPELTNLRRFDERGSLYVAAGQSITLLVEAKPKLPASQADNSELELSIPDHCELSYWGKNGVSGRTVLKKTGRSADGNQLFNLDGPPLDQISKNLRFQIRGDDHLIGPYTIQVVEPPIVVETNLECQFPGYMVDYDSLRWTPRTIPWTLGSKLPVGTKLTVRCRCSKPISKVYLSDSMSSSLVELKPIDDKFEFSIDNLLSKVQLRIYPFDELGVGTDQPFQFAIEPIDDKSPRIVSRLKGIGSAITPQAQLPIKGKIDDDYGLGRSWAEIDLPDEQVINVPLPVLKNGDLDATIDLRELKVRSEVLTSEPSGESSISIVVKSQDRYDLAGKPNETTGESFKLELVTPNDLLRIIERRESAERRRLEQAEQELNDAREYLVRILGRGSQLSRPDLIEPGDESRQANPQDEKEKSRMEIETRSIYASRFRSQIDKSAAEILGVAEAFEDLRLQLVNNRLNALERESRLEKTIVEPLRLISYNLRMELQDRSRKIQAALEGPLTRNSDTLSPESQIGIECETCIAKLDSQLVELREVISSLLKFETQNELLDIVRAMLKTQKELLQQTEEQRKKDAFEGLID